MRGLAALLVPLLAIMLLAVDDTAGGEKPQLAYADLMVNAQAHGEALVAVTDSDVLVDKRALDRIHLVIGTATTRIIGGRTFVSLRSLAPAATYDFNDATFALNIQADESILPVAEFNFGVHSEQPLSFVSSRAGFLNYALIQTEGAALGYSGQLGYSSERALLTSTFSSEGTQFRRGDTYLENADVNS